MKNIKRLLIISIIVLIILISIIFMLMKTGGNMENREILDGETDIEQIKKMANIDDYLEVKNSMVKYLDTINVNSSAFYTYNDNGERIQTVKDDYINEQIMQVLSQEYISKKSINTNNVRDYIYKIDGKSFFTPIEIVEKGSKQNVKSFGVYGLITTMKYEPVGKIYMIVNIDKNNLTFSVQEVNSKEELDNSTVNIPNEIQEKENNTYEQIRRTYEDLLREYINDYKILSLAYPELLYNNFFDNEYKTKKFGNVENFKKYVNENKNQIIRIYPEKYEISEETENTQYTVIDSNQKKYIFNSKNASEYKILLDTYTISSPQDIEKYKEYNEQQKVALNIDKFIQAINDSDYKYAYNCLADSYKNNYFRTQADFETYAKQNFYTKSTIGYKQFSMEGEVYTYSVVLTNQKTGEKMNKTFICRLGEGTAFELSFNK